MAATVFVAAVLIAAGLEAGSSTSMLTASPAIAVIFGTIMGLLHHRRLWSVFWGSAVGLLLGASSAWSLIGHGVDDVFVIVLATLALFIGLGFFVGSFIEFVQFLHFIAHGNKAKDYRQSGK